MFVFRLSVAALIAFAAGVLQAQDRPSATRTAGPVLVDFSVTVDGKSVQDLTPGEVQVVEDGVPQAVLSFEHVGDQADGGHPARALLVFLDTLHSRIEESSALRLPLIRLLDRLLGPEDTVALVTPELADAPLEFAPKGVVISNIMQADWAWNRRGRPDTGDQKERLYEACYGSARLGQTTFAAEMIARRREQVALDALGQLVQVAPGVEAGRKALLVVSDGWQLFRPNDKLAAGEPSRERTRDVFGRTPRPSPGDRSNAGVDRAECEADRVALARMDHTQRLREITDEANRFNVTFYPLYASGLAAEGSGAAPPREGAASAHVGQDALKFLADNSDGNAVLANVDLEAGLQRLREDMSSYYLLTYASSNTRLDGRQRTIDVHVSRQGARVRHRRGYRGRTADDLIGESAATGTTTGGATVALDLPPAPNARSQFRIRTSTWSRPTATGQPEGGFWIVGEIDYRTRRELAWTSGATADVKVLAVDGTEVVSRTESIRTEDGPFGVEVPESGGLPAGEYAVSVQLRSDADTTLTLMDTARVVLGAPSGLGEAVLWRRGPTTGLQHRRTADPRFQRSDRLRLELPSMVQGAPAARLLDRNGAVLNVPVQVAERGEASDGLRWVVVDASLAPLAPGDYAIEVTQGEARRVTGFRIVP